MRAGFFGTPSAAVVCLAALVDIADVPLVVTMPDRPKGRRGSPTPPPVKEAALEWGLEVAQPTSSAELGAAVADAELDVGVVVAYGRILHSEVLSATRVGFVNVHFSLLPRWRGAAPVERAILEGDEVTGVCLMVLDEGLDTGPLVSVVETPIADDETGGSLGARLSHLGAGLLADALPGFMIGDLQPAPQIATGATHAPKLTVAEAELDPHRGAGELERAVRAFDPRPGAWLLVEGRRMKVKAASLADDGPELGVIAGRDGAPVLGTVDGGLRLEKVQPAGKRVQTGAEWLNGRRGEPAHAGR